MNITDVCIQTRRKEITETCAVEHGTRTEHFACRKSALLLNKVCDDVHRIGNDHHGAAIVVLHDILNDVTRNCDVLCRKIKPRFTGLSSDARSDDDKIAVHDIGISTAVNVHRTHRDEAVADIHGFAFCLLRIDVNDDDLRNKALRCDGERDGRADCACTDNADFGRFSFHNV